MATRLVCLGTLALLAQPAAALVTWSIGPPWWVFATDVACNFGFAALLWRLRMPSANPRALGHLYCLLGTIQVAVSTWVMGGLFGAVAIIALAGPVSATVVIGPRAGWGWLGVQIAWWLSWALLGDTDAAVQAVTMSVPAWTGSVLFSLCFVGVMFLGAASFLHMLEADRRRELAATLDALEDRVVERTAALRAEVEERRRAEHAARQADLAKSAFLANMSHELRTPVTTIVGFTEMVRETLEDEPSADVRPDLAKVLFASSHLLGLIDAVLDLARVESGQLELRPEPVLVRTLVEPVVAMVRPLADANGNRMQVDVDDRCSVLADAGRTRQILLNLLSNANKFTTDGTVEVRVTNESGGVCITVSDTGSGIAPEHLEDIFGRFAQVQLERVDHPGGTGLGLTIARQLAEAMDGALTATSTIGVGSQFALRLPSAMAPSIPQHDSALQ